MNTEKDSAANARRSVIHIGLHKVASTTLQHSLRALKVKLEKQGFFYPTDHLPLRTQHSDLATFLREDDQAKYRAAMGAILDEFDRRGYANMLLSGEGFSSLLPAQIEVLHRDLAQTGRQFRVVLYVRNLYRHTMSAIAQKGKSGKPVSFSSRGISRRKFDPSSILSRWEAVFGEDNVVAGCLEALPAEANIVTHFAASAGITLPRGFRILDRNRSADPIASSLLSRLAYEFRFSHHLFYRSYFENVPDRPTLPRVEDRLFGIIDKWVAEVDLSHPKLASFQDLLCQRPSVSANGANAQSAAGYIRQLGMTLLGTAARIEEEDRQRRGGQRGSIVREGRPRRQRKVQQHA